MRCEKANLACVLFQIERYSSQTDCRDSRQITNETNQKYNVDISQPKSGALLRAVTDTWPPSRQPQSKNSQLVISDISDSQLSQTQRAPHSSMPIFNMKFLRGLPRPHSQPFLTSIMRISGTVMYHLTEAVRSMMSLNDGVFNKLI